jgi:iron complex transport system permease protein
MATATERAVVQLRTRPRERLRFHGHVHFWIASVFLLGMLVVAVVLATGIGSVHIPVREIVALVLNRCGVTHIAQTWPTSDEIIVLQIRIPRVIGAALVGAALSVAGTLFQGLLRNPLADPYVIGTSGGAALGATIGVFLVSTLATIPYFAVPTLAFGGALATMVLVYWLARVEGRTPVVTLLLAGFAVSVILGYVVSFLLMISDRLQLNMVYAWLLGSISATRWSHLAVIASLVLACTGLSVVLGRSLNALSLGDEAAEYLGVHVEQNRAAIIVLGSFLTAAAVSVGGLIGFVGLIVPHTLRLIFGPDHSRLLTLSALGGATFLVLADLLARTVLAPTELPVGILTAFIGGPAFLFLLRRSKREYRF